MGVLFPIILCDNRFLHCTNFWYSHIDTSLKMLHCFTLNHFLFFASLVAHRFLMKHGGKIGIEVTMWRKHKEVKHTRVCVTKGKKINGSPRILNTRNGWKKFKTTNELKVGDHLVFTLIVTSTLKVEIVNNIKNCKIICKQQALKDVVDHYFPSTIPCLGTTHTSKIK
jgi:hypothetical protein